MNNLKFRIWDSLSKIFIDNIIIDINRITLCKHRDYLECIADFSEYDKIIKRNKLDIGNFTIQQSIGLNDKTNKEVYQGDIIKFDYSVGDFAWETMTEKEIAENEGMSGQTYVAEVVWDENQSANILVVGDRKSTHMQFPAMYVKDGEVLGNIFENPELNTKL